LKNGNGATPMTEECSRPSGDANMGGCPGVNGAEIIATPESFSESVLERVREFADSHPEIEVEIAGGLADQYREMEKAAADFEAPLKPFGSPLPTPPSRAATYCLKPRN
jgi:hypothetical protein